VGLSKLCTGLQSLRYGLGTVLGSDTYPPDLIIYNGEPVTFNGKYVKQSGAETSMSISLADALSQSNDIRSQITRTSLIGANPTIVKVNSAGVTTSANDIRTVPTGKRSVLVSSKVYHATNTCWLQVKVGGAGSYRQLMTSTGAATSGQGASANMAPTGYVFNAGDIVSIGQTNTGAGTEIVTNVSFIEFDAPSDGSGLKTVIVADLANGGNMIYTCPSGRQTLFPAISTATTAPQLGQWGGGTTAFVWNASGSTRAYKLHLVPSGGSAGATNVVSEIASTTNLTRCTLLPGGTLDAGDFVSINTDSGDAGQFAWLTVYEIPA